MNGLLLTSAQQFMPLVNIDPSTIVFTLINTALIVLAYRFFFHNKVEAILDARMNKINAEKTLLEQERLEAQKAKEQHEAELLKTKQDYSDIMEDAVRAAKKKEEAIISEAMERVRVLQEQAEQQIRQERLRAVSEAKEELAGMVVAATEMMLNRTLTEEDNEEIIEKFLQNVGS
jgi:F-type H+-transporting ATPase subunit b